MMATRHENHKTKHKAKDFDESDGDQAVVAQAEVTPLTLTGGNYDVRITEGYNDGFVGHSITAPSANLQRNNTVTVANPTPPTNVPVKWQGTPGTPYIALAPTPPSGVNISNNPSLNFEDNSYAPASWTTAAPLETPAGRGAFINGLDSLIAGGKPESSGQETSQSLTGTTSLTSGWPRPAGDGSTSVTVSAYNRGTGPETYTEFPNQIHPSTVTPVYANNPTVATNSPATTTAGTGTIAVTLTGTNFTRYTKVTVDGVVVPTTFTNSTTIVGTVPKKPNVSAASATVIGISQGDAPMGVSASGLAFT